MSKPRRINVEPLIFIQSLSYGISSTISTAFVTFKCCLWLLDSSHVHVSPNPHDYCLRLGSNSTTINISDLEYLNRVQSAVARFNIIQQAIGAVPHILSTVYFGAWSDKNGRKMPMVLGLAGNALGAQIMLITAAIDSIPVYVILAPVLISAVSGGGLFVYTGCYTIISDSVHNPPLLTIRIALASGIVSIGTLLAQLAFGFVLERWDDYALSFMCNGIVEILAFGYAVFGLQETIEFSKRRMIKTEEDGNCIRNPAEDSIRPDIEKSNEANGGPDGVLRNFFKYTKDSLKILIKPRRGRRRFYLLITVVSFMFLFMVEPFGVFNLFAKRPPLSLTDSEYSFITATGSAVKLMPVMIIWLLKPNDMSLMVAGIAFGVVQMAITAFSIEKWMFYLAMGMGGVAHLHYSGHRSFLTKLVDPTETGRLFAAIGVIGNFCPLLGTVISSNIYAESLQWFPGFVFLLSAICSFIVMMIMSYVYFDIKRRGEDVGQDEKPSFEPEVGCSDTEALVN